MWIRVLRFRNDHQTWSRRDGCRWPIFCTRGSSIVRNRIEFYLWTSFQNARVRCYGWWPGKIIKTFLTFVQHSDFWPFKEVAFDWPLSNVASLSSPSLPRINCELTRIRPNVFRADLLTLSRRDCNRIYEG